LHNGIDLSFWKPEITQNEARRKLSLPLDRPLFLFAGRIGHDKGSTAITRTLPAAAHLIVAGSVDRSIFRDLSGRVHFFPDQTAEQMRSLYAACDVALVLSIYLDPFPTVCLEAMACERPVIATTHGGAKEAVENSRTGWVVDPLNEVELRDRLESCLQNPTELRRCGREGRRHVESNFSQTIYLDNLLAIYGQCHPAQTQKPQTILG
jgi:glycosyltransferase involved in cell wall biosynthesis